MMQSALSPAGAPIRAHNAPAAPAILHVLAGVAWARREDVTP
jgi:hypothetical protein